MYARSLPSYVILLLLTVKHKEALTISHVVLVVVDAGEIRWSTGRVTHRGEATYEMMLRLGARSVE